MPSNGQFVPITQSSSTNLTIGDHILTLSHLLHVPSLAKNLISIKQLCIDTNVTIAFLPDSFCIKDLSIRILILEGGDENVLYNLSTQSLSLFFTMGIM